MLGVEWPPTKGWIDRIVGKEISEESVRKFVEYGQKRPTKSERKKIKALAKVGKRVEKKERRKHWDRMVAKVTSDSFLQSYEWRRVRMEVLKRDGARCACCGATRADGVVLHVDHIKPRRTYPRLALDVNNLQVLCEVCNHGKGNWDQTDWRKQEPANDELGEQQQQHIRSIVEGS